MAGDEAWPARLAVAVVVVVVAVVGWDPVCNGNDCWVIFLLRGLPVVVQFGLRLALGR